MDTIPEANHLQLEDPESFFKEILDSKLFDAKKEEHNEALTRVRASEILATFADHLNAHSEGTLSETIAWWWTCAGVGPTNFTVTENLYPRREYPFVALSAEVNMDVNVGDPHGPLVEAGTRVDLLWLETDREDPSKLILAKRWVFMTKPKGCARYIIRQVNTSYHSLGQKDPGGLLSEIFDVVVDTGDDKIPDRMHRIVGEGALIEAYERLEKSARFKVDRTAYCPDETR